MFLKRMSIRKNGKRRTYWALVKSVRTPRGPRHQVVSFHAELEAGGGSVQPALVHLHKMANLL